MQEVSYTSRSIITGTESVMQIFHDLDGEWQFFGKKMPENKDVQITSREKILERHKDLAEIVQKVKPGYYATREQVGGNWSIKKDS